MSSVKNAFKEFAREMSLSSFNLPEIQENIMELGEIANWIISEERAEEQVLEKFNAIYERYKSAHGRLKESKVRSLADENQARLLEEYLKGFLLAIDEAFHKFPNLIKVLKEKMPAINAISKGPIQRKGPTKIDSPKKGPLVKKGPAQEEDISQEDKKLIEDFMSSYVAGSYAEEISEYSYRKQGDCLLIEASFSSGAFHAFPTLPITYRAEVQLSHSGHVATVNYVKFIAALKSKKNADFPAIRGEKYADLSAANLYTPENHEFLLQEPSSFSMRCSLLLSLNQKGVVINNGIRNFLNKHPEYIRAIDEYMSGLQSNLCKTSPEHIYAYFLFAAALESYENESVQHRSTIYKTLIDIERIILTEYPQYDVKIRSEIKNLCKAYSVPHSFSTSSEAEASKHYLDYIKLLETYINPEMALAVAKLKQQKLDGDPGLLQILRKYPKHAFSLASGIVTLYEAKLLAFGAPYLDYLTKNPEYASIMASGIAKLDELRVPLTPENLAYLAQYPKDAVNRAQLLGKLHKYRLLNDVNRKQLMQYSNRNYANNIWRALLDMKRNGRVINQEDFAFLMEHPAHALDMALALIKLKGVPFAFLDDTSSLSNDKSTKRDTAIKMYLRKNYQYAARIYSGFDQLGPENMDQATVSFLLDHPGHADHIATVVKNIPRHIERERLLADLRNNLKHIYSLALGLDSAKAKLTAMHSYQEQSERLYSLVIKYPEHAPEIVSVITCLLPNGEGLVKALHFLSESLSVFQPQHISDFLLGFWRLTSRGMVINEKQDGGISLSVQRINAQMDKSNKIFLMKYPGYAFNIAMGFDLCRLYNVATPANLKTIIQYRAFIPEIKFAFETAFERNQKTFNEIIKTFEDRFVTFMMAEKESKTEPNSRCALHHAFFKSSLYEKFLLSEIFGYVAPQQAPRPKT